MGAAAGSLIFFIYLQLHPLFPLSKPHSGLPFSMKPSEASGGLDQLDIRCLLRQITRLHYFESSLSLMPVFLSRPITHVGHFEETI